MPSTPQLLFCPLTVYNWSIRQTSEFNVYLIFLGVEGITCRYLKITLSSGDIINEVQEICAPCVEDPVNRNVLLWFEALLLCISHLF